MDAMVLVVVVDTVSSCCTPQLQLHMNDTVRHQDHFVALDFVTMNTMDALDIVNLNIAMARTFDWRMDLVSDSCQTATQMLAVVVAHNTAAGRRVEQPMAKQPVVVSMDIDSNDLQLNLICCLQLRLSDLNETIVGRTMQMLHTMTYYFDLWPLVTATNRW